MKKGCTVKNDSNAYKIIRFLYSGLFLVLLLFLVTCKTDIRNIMTRSNGEPLSTEKEITYIYIPRYHEIYIEIDNQNKEVLLLVPSKSEINLSEVQLNFSFSDNATSNFKKEKKYNLTKNMKIKVVAEDRSKAVYTIIAQRVQGGKSAVIVSDTQNDIIPLFHQEEFFKNANIVIDKANKANVPIYYIMLKSLKGFDAWEIPEELHFYDDGIIVDKGDTVDSFEGTGLHKELLLKGIDTVYVIGISSLGCVLGTCKSASSKKYNVFLVRDAHDEPIGYRTAESVEQCNLKVERNNYGELIYAKDLEF
jgi:Isochorismatase family